MLEFCCVQSNRAGTEVLRADQRVIPHQQPPALHVTEPAKRSSPFLGPGGQPPVDTSAAGPPPPEQQSTTALVPTSAGEDGQGSSTALALLSSVAQGDPELSPLSSARSDAELTQEEKDREKKRLQELVKKFTKDAVKGVACQVVQLQDGLKREATYALDRSLQTFTLEENETGKAVHWSIANIVDVYRSEESQLVRSRKETSLTGLSWEDLGRCVLLEYDNGIRGESHEFTLLLEGSVRQKERFFTCMKILRLYTMSSPDEE